jgi:phosphinothricin acetyltransferase
MSNEPQSTDRPSRTIRLATPADADGIAAIYNPYCIHTAVTFEVEPILPAEMAERIANLGARFPWVVLEESGKLLGYAHAGPHHPRAAYCWAANVSVYVADGYHRTGAGRALYRSLFGLMWLQGFTQALAGITLPNPASVALHESLGFQKMGVYQQIGHKLGAWRDVGWWQRLLGPLPDEPTEPLSTQELTRLAGFADALATGILDDDRYDH